MRKLLILLALPLFLSGCSLAPSRNDERFASITDGKTFVEYMIPRGRSVIESSAQLLRIRKSESAKEVPLAVLRMRSTEIRTMMAAYRSWTGSIYPMDINTKPAPVANLDGLPEAEATEAYAKAMIEHDKLSIEAAKHAKTTGTGTTLTVLADTVIETYGKEIEQLQQLLEAK